MKTDRDVLQARGGGSTLRAAASSPGLPFVKSANPQPPDAAYLF